MIIEVRSERIVMDIQKILTKLHISELNEMQQHAAEAILGSDGDVRSHPWLRR